MVEMLVANEQIVANWVNGNKEEAVRQALVLSPARFAVLVMQISCRIDVEDGAAKFVKMLEDKGEPPPFVARLSVWIEGKRWLTTGKYGICLKNGIRTAEYQNGGKRIWIDALGKVNPE